MDDADWSDVVPDALGGGASTVTIGPPLLAGGLPSPIVTVVPLPPPSTVRSGCDALEESCGATLVAWDESGTELPESPVTLVAWGAS
ncbi:MAG: hypothetical protein WAQ33_17180 [Gaiellaceae bacterium]